MVAINEATTLGPVAIMCGVSEGRLRRRFDRLFPHAERLGGKRVLLKADVPRLLAGFNGSGWVKPEPAATAEEA